VREEQGVDGRRHSGAQDEGYKEQQQRHQAVQVVRGVPIGHQQVESALAFVRHTEQDTPVAAGALS
jgi:hypothetical protein